MGTLQDLLVEEEFERLLDKFVAENAEIFEDSEENKLEYLPIFKKYKQIVETHLQKRLKQEIPGFSMKRMEELMMENKEDIDENVLDTLKTFEDFLAFKETMLLYKKNLEPTPKTFQKVEEQIDEDGPTMITKKEGRLDL
jgi:ADP-ribosylation factor-like protein 2-binding protein